MRRRPVDDLEVWQDMAVLRFGDIWPHIDLQLNSPFVYGAASFLSRVDLHASLIGFDDLEG